MSPVYIVKVYQGSYDDKWWHIYRVCSDPHIAEDEKRKLEKRIESVKAEYEKEFGSNYDSDYKNMMDIPKEKRWNQVYLYEDKHTILKYHTIAVIKYEVL